MVVKSFCNTCGKILIPPIPHKYTHIVTINYTDKWDVAKTKTLPKRAEFDSDKCYFAYLKRLFGDGLSIPTNTNLQVANSLFSPCDACGKVFDDKDKLHAHRIAEHQDETEA